MKQKIIYIISNINKSLAFEWVAQYLDHAKYDLVFILLNQSDSVLEKHLQSINVRVYRVHYAGKGNAISAFFKTYAILKKERANVVHAHLIEACLIGLLAAYVAGVKKRIHTRHNSTFHHLFFPRAVWYDKLINFLSTDIVAISDVVKKVLVKQEGVALSKIHMIHHGFVFEDPETISKERVNTLRNKYGLSIQESPVIGVISRFIKWKGIQYIITAFVEVLKKHNNAVLLLANAKGPYEKELHKLLKALPENSYRIIPFEEDVFALYKLMDVFVHVPINYDIEAFGQTYVEALSLEVPSVFTLSGIANEFITDKENALVVDYENSNQIFSAINLLLNDRELAVKLATKGKEHVLDKFDIKNTIKLLQEMYDS